MHTRWAAVCVTVTFSFLALVHSADAVTKSSPKKPQGISNRVSRTAAGNRAGVSRTVNTRTKPACAPCAVGQKTRGRSLNKGRTSKNIPCHPKDYVDPKIARNYKAAMRDMKRAGIKPQITSVWRSSENQAQLRRCSLSTRCRRANPGLYRALPAGKSMHEAGFAVDIAGIAAGPRGQKRLTPKGRRIVGIMKKNGFKWRYGLSDPAHFEADPRKYGYRNPQQAINKTQTTCQIGLAKNKSRKKPGRVTT
ncbi:MAG TPA: D-alanyl-D-alanine carboxypeptidase family protein [Blastocatellia bacterium]|nr:D-alanyl-D-alanine carboxypeptidase family protein [Blastocatellia bacterium]